MRGTGVGSGEAPTQVHVVQTQGKQEVLSFLTALNTSPEYFRRCESLCPLVNRILTHSTLENLKSIMLREVRHRIPTEGVHFRETLEKAAGW